VVGRGAVGQLAVQVLHRLGDRCRGAGVAGQVRQRGQVEQSLSQVDDQQGDLLGRISGGQLPGDEPEQAGLAALGVTKDEQVWRPHEQVEPDQFQAMLLDGERQPRRCSVGGWVGGPQDRLPDQRGQEPERGRDRAAAARHGMAEDGARRAGEGGLELEAGPGEAAARHHGQGRCRRPAELGLQRVVESKLEAAAEVLAEAGRSSAQRLAARTRWTP
jgi:hypothetical protein